MDSPSEIETLKQKIKDLEKKLLILRKCSVCGSGDHIKVCEVCGGTTCTDHGGAYNIVSAKCITCKKECCRRCWAIQMTDGDPCEKCGGIACKKCSEEFMACCDCGCNYCDDCSTIRKCQNCKSVMCSDCGDTTSEGGECEYCERCDKCIDCTKDKNQKCIKCKNSRIHLPKKCLECGVGLCKDCNADKKFTECEYCGDYICLICLDLVCHTCKLPLHKKCFDIHYKNCRQCEKCKIYTLNMSRCNKCHYICCDDCSRHRQEDGYAWGECLYCGERLSIVKNN